MMREIGSFDEAYQQFMQEHNIAKKSELLSKMQDIISRELEQYKSRDKALNPDDVRAVRDFMNRFQSASNEFTQEINESNARLQRMADETFG